MVATRHSLLARQIRNFLEPAGEPNLALEVFLDAVDAAYRQYDQDRGMLERSLELSSRELIQTNADLRLLLEAERRAQSEMTRARVLAETASHAKSEFLATISHELRTPMNGIIGMTECALETRLDAEQREYLGVVRDSAYTLSRILGDILDFSKIDSGTFDLENEAFDLKECLATSVRTLEFRARGKGLSLSLEIDPDIPSDLCGDAGRLQQVLVNLVANAVKFTERGSIAIAARRVVDAESDRLGDRGGDPACTIEFCVSDTGIGVDVEKQAEIFEPFIQGDGSDRRRFGGAGLGLAISRRIVEMMGGRMWVESTRGIGSRFFFTTRLGLTGAHDRWCERRSLPAGDRAA